MKKFDFLFSQFDEKVSEVFKQGKDSTWFLLYKDHSVGPEKPGTGLLQSLRKRQWYFKKNWIIVDLQCCINFSCTAKWLIYINVYIDMFFYILFHYGLS